MAYSWKELLNLRGDIRLVYIIQRYKYIKNYFIENLPCILRSGLDKLDFFHSSVDALRGP